MDHKARINSATGSMRREMHHALRRSIALILIVFMAAGCSKAVEIPRSDIDDPKYREPGSYRIRLLGGDEYFARRFSVTDSTIVIEELLESKEMRQSNRDRPAISIPLDSLEAVERIDVNEKVVIVGVTLGAAIWTFLLLAFTEVDE